MKSKLGTWFASLENKRGIGQVVKTVRAAWMLVAHNFGLKLLSLLVAILLWNFVITSNSSITRTKTITGLNGYVSGQSILTGAYGLALLEDPAQQLTDISVMVEVSQSEFVNVTGDNVQVTLDLSNARRAGVQEIPLKATTSYGRIVRIMPSTVTVSLETLDSRVIPVNVKTGGKPQKDRWYKVNKSNPQSLTIKGPASVVQSIASANVEIDVTGARSGFTAAEKYKLVDSNGNEIPQNILERSASSISVSMDVYPMKEIAIGANPDSIITGQPADGYVVKSVEIQPDTLTVAADQELLDSIDVLHIDPISVEGASQSFSVRSKVSRLSAFKSISAEEVYVTVTVEEESVSAWVDDVRISYVNKGEGLYMVAPPESIRVYVTGPRSEVEKLQETGFIAIVDLQGLGVGVHSLQASFPENYEDVEFTPEIGEIKVELEE